eukprot:3538735-Rhodomonas_salina.3
MPQRDLHMTCRQASVCLIFRVPSPLHLVHDAQNPIEALTRLIGAFRSVSSWRFQVPPARTSHACLVIAFLSALSSTSLGA